METAASVETWTTGATPFAGLAASVQRRLTTSPPMLGNATRSHSHHSPHDDEISDLEENEKASDRRALDAILPAPIVQQAVGQMGWARCPPGAQLTMTPRDFALRPVTTDSQNQPF